MAWVTIAEAAQALDVSQDTISRRRKAGEIPAQQESIPSGFRWLVEIDDDLAGALGKAEGADAGEHAAGQPAPVMIEELAALRARVEELRHTVEILERHAEELAADRDAWRDQAARADRIAERAQVLQERAQPAQLTANVAEPASTTPDTSGGTTQTRSPTPEDIWNRLRRWLTRGGRDES